MAKNEKKHKKIRKKIKKGLNSHNLNFFSISGLNYLIERHLVTAH
jgi:hypothetical protein